MSAPRATEADLLARDLYDARCEIQESGRALHDHAGPLLSAAGIQLQLLRMDHPATAAGIEETLALLDQVTENIRALSHNLDASPASHIGLDRALAQLSEFHSSSVELSYKADTKIPPCPAAVVYDAVVTALGKANGSGVRIAVRGTSQRLAVRIAWKGGLRWPRSEVSALARRLRPAGVSLDVTTKRSTIVSILYATRRSSRR